MLPVAISPALALPGTQCGPCSPGLWSSLLPSGCVPYTSFLPSLREPQATLPQPGALVTQPLTSLPSHRPNPVTPHPPLKLSSSWDPYGAASTVPEQDRRTWSSFQQALGEHMCCQDCARHEQKHCQATPSRPLLSDPQAAPCWGPGAPLLLFLHQQSFLGGYTKASTIPRARNLAATGLGDHLS